MPVKGAVHESAGRGDSYFERSLELRSSSKSIGPVFNSTKLWSSEKYASDPTSRNPLISTSM